MPATFVPPLRVNVVASLVLGELLAPTKVGGLRETLKVAADGVTPDRVKATEGAEV